MTPAAERARVDQILRAAAVRTELIAAVPGAATGAECRVLDAKYRPGQHCTVLYSVGRRPVRGDVDLRDGGAPLLLWPFPDDPDLPGLRAVWDPAALNDLLTPALAAGGNCRATLLRYRPAKRATIAVRVGAASGGAARCYIGKLYHDLAKAAAVHAESDAIIAAGSHERARVLVLARSAALLPGLALVLQQAVRGTPLDQLLGSGRGTAATPAVLARVAEALAALHALPRVSDRRRPVRTEVSRFRRRAEQIARVDPAVGARLSAVADRLIADVDTIGDGDVAGPVTVVHGDCKPSQFLLGAQTVAVLDLDHLGLADPASDVGTFLGSLRQLGVRDGLAAPGSAAARRRSLAALGAALLRAYTDAAVRSGVPDRDLARRALWYEAVALERKALRAYARCPRSPLAGALADDAWDCLAEYHGRRP